MDSNVRIEEKVFVVGLGDATIDYCLILAITAIVNVAWTCKIKTIVVAFTDHNNDDVWKTVFLIQRVNIVYCTSYIAMVFKDHYIVSFINAIVVDEYVFEECYVFFFWHEKIKTWLEHRTKPNTISLQNSSMQRYAGLYLSFLSTMATMSAKLGAFTAEPKDRWVSSISTTCSK